MAERGLPDSKTLPPEAATGTAPERVATPSVHKSSTEGVTDRPQQERVLRNTDSEAVMHLGPEVSGSDQPLRDGCHSGTCTPEIPVHHSEGRPHSIAEAQGLPWAGPSERAGASGVTNHWPHTDRSSSPAWRENHVASSSHRDLREEQLEPTKQCVQRSRSDSLRPTREVWAPLESMATSYCSMEAGACLTLVCKQAMQMQQNNTVTICRCGSNSPTQPAGGVRLCLPSAEDAGSQHLACVEACYGPHMHTCGLEDTFSAYCHSLPIPAPAPLLPRPGEVEPRGLRTPHHSTLLAFPRLVSSVSETGLDARRVARCCSADRMEQGASQPRHECHLLEGRRSRDASTMTSHSELRDVGVQTGHPQPAPPPHVFPEVSLVQEAEPEGPETQKSLVKEVAWDAEGMTWEVYGASVDPEELGLAIQKHLELQIKETASRAARLVRQDSGASQRSRWRRKRGSVMDSLKSPACCARSSTTAD